MQENLPTRLVLGMTRPRPGDCHTLPLVQIEDSMGLLHLHPPDGLNNLLLQGYSPESAGTMGRMYISKTGEG